MENLMVGNLEPEENVLPEWFEQTSDKPYTRHNYKLVYANNQSTVFESWEELRNEWWNAPSQFVSHVEVLDIKQSKNQKGFK
jgi:hypothetical protein